MAGYREHISVSGVLGICYGTAAAVAFGFTPVQGTLAGILTWIAGMLPDLDSETGKPVREIFGLLAAVAPLVLLRRLMYWAGDFETCMLLAIGLYAAIRYGGSTLLARVCVHRGMFHSIPALLIAAELTFLAYQSDRLMVRVLMAGGTALGFVSHLILDEMYSVEWTGVRIKLNKAAGSAMKIVGKKFLPNVVTFALLSVLTYATLVDLGLVQDPGLHSRRPLLQQATEPPPVRR